MAVSKPDQRIDQGWKACRGWITVFDGAPTVSLLVGVPDKALLPALSSLAERTENFRITSIASAQRDEAQFISLENLSEHLEGLRAGSIADLSVNYALRSTAFDLDIHLTVYAAENQQLVLELVWWSDQVFSDETDNYAQFSDLMEYFIGLQELFSASHLLVSSESQRGPGLEAEDWVEI
jgi:hypothetical protein